MIETRDKEGLQQGFGIGIRLEVGGGMVFGGVGERVWIEIGNGERFGGVNGMELESRTGLGLSLGLVKGFWIGVGRG